MIRLMERLGAYLRKACLGLAAPRREPESIEWGSWSAERSLRLEKAGLIRPAPHRRGLGARRPAPGPKA